MTERIWLEQYPPGVPADIDPDQYSSLSDMLESSLRQHGSSVAYHYIGRDFLYGDIERLSAALAGYFESLGLGAGDRVGVMLPNMPQLPIAVIAALRKGLIVVNINPLYTAKELASQLNDALPRALLVSDSALPALRASGYALPPQHVIACARLDGLRVDGGGNGACDGTGVGSPGYTCMDEALAFGRGVAWTSPQFSAEDVAVIQYTGGTTGVSKGAMLTHRNLVANLLQFEAWNEPVMKTIPDGQQATSVAALPMYHIFAFTVIMMLSLRTGGRTIIIPDARNLAEMLDILSRQVFHDLPGVNTLFNALVNHPDFERVDWSHLRVCVGGGAPIQAPVAERWFAKTGCPIREGYGLTEASPSVSANPATHVRFNGTIGLPLPNTFVKLLDDSEEEVPVGEPGEIAVKGPQVMRGYWKRPEETALVMTADGYLKTGDIGVMDDRGYIRIVDRKKDMILISGFNVFPNEIEEVVAGMPEVLECAVVGEFSEKTGEVVKLFVVPRTPNLDEDTIKAYCKERLAGYKQPQRIVFIDALPKSPVGKILRRELRTQTAQ